MASVTPPSLNARKRPVQARAAVTLDAIFEATIQLLLSDGPHKLTTTRVAERAGVSVGTMYQYFPHKRALIYALNERYLETLARTIETTCEEHRGRRAGDMIEALLDAYWRAKTERSDITRALYRSVADMDNGALIDAFAVRADAATTAMFASASDVTFADLVSANRTLVTVIFGTVRNAFERGLSETAAKDLKRQLLTRCRAYLQETDTVTSDEPHKYHEVHPTTKGPPAETNSPGDLPICCLQRR